MELAESVSQSIGNVKLTAMCLVLCVMVHPHGEQAVKECAGPCLRLIRDLVAHDETVYDAGARVGDAGCGIEVSSMHDAWLDAKRIVRRQGTHITGSKQVE
jgi:hypothetical protein